MDICFISLGCDKNLVDSEMMVTSLRKSGYNIVYNAEEADIIVVNTCCFIGDAKEESINTLIEMAGYKENGKCRLLAATGCLAQRYHEEIKKELPEVDIIIGTTAYESLIEGIQSALGKNGTTECLKALTTCQSRLQTGRPWLAGAMLILKLLRAVINAVHTALFQK